MSKQRRIIDLTMDVHEGMQTFQTYWHPFVEVTQLGRHGIENRETRKLILGTHTGTHVDAPRHFVPDGMTVDEIPLENMNGPAILLDFSDLDDCSCVTRSMLEDAVGTDSVERVLIRFDGEKRLGTMAYYEDQPWLTDEAAQWLVDKGCKLIGLDVAMPDNPVNGRQGPTDSPVHKIFLTNQVVILEYLVDLKKIGARHFDLVVAPLKIRGGDGAPARCFAVVID
ncbi:cyclase family protein [Desulfovibrio sp. JC010]|uniref:cyclase family protein n=1 Tax=Desulfovibrio sp. JC010 TaxID=2593641 RepID=UPI0013D563D9|nr:cyclase family protein [Desulfovibrio sp. JC010]NDV27175.1 cyclase family protein [Desulfovibrio sp. JC010]